MIVSLQEIADRTEAVVKVLADYKRGDDRALRIFAEDTLKEIVADVRETIAAEAATAPAPDAAPEGETRHGHAKRGAA